VSEAALTSWTCPTCAVTVTSAYCSTCGEKPKHPRDFTLAGLAHMTYQAFSPVDGKVLRSFITLLRRPGSLTVAFQHAQRIPFLGPFQIFLLANVLFFAVQSSGTMKIFSQPLAYRIGPDGLWQETSKIIIDARLAQIGKTFAEYAPFFDQAVEVNAKSLIGLMVPPFALLLPLVFLRCGQPLAVNFVFSLHYYAFVLLLLCVPVGAMEVSTLLSGPAIPPQWLDNTMGIGLMIACAAYLYIAIGPVFGTRGPTRVLQAAVLSVATAGIFLCYRFVVMLITLYTT